MIKHFLNLEWKQYFRSSYWQTGIALKVIMAIFAIYLIVSFLFIGVGGYYLLEKQFPDQDPLKIVNSVLVFAILGDLIFRYLMQKLPVMNIKPMLILPIKKTKLAHYVLGKSAFSFFNIMPLFFYVPFAVVLIKEGYNIIGVLGWLLAMLFVILTVNYVNFLINKNAKAFWIIAPLTIALFALQHFNVFDIKVYSQKVFDTLFAYPILAVAPLAITILFYFLNFNFLKDKLFLDDAISKKVKEANTADLTWANRFGDTAPFIKNDIRLIWRNKRTKTVFFMSFVLLFYGLFVFGTPKIAEEMPAFLVFGALFVTGGFALNYGQFIPAWDSAHYKMIMSQNIRYREFLESKWMLMVTLTGILYIFSIPYLYFGLQAFLLITAGAIFNIGFNTLFLLFAGSFNRKRIDLNKSGFSNMQGTSATQFIIIIPLLGFPMLLFWIFSDLINFNAGVIAIAVVGVLGIVFKGYCMNLIEKKYINDKYEAIKAFDEKA